MTDLYSMPENRTFCGRFRCCREKNHSPRRLPRTAHRAIRHLFENHPNWQEQA